MTRNGGPPALVAQMGALKLLLLDAAATPPSRRIDTLTQPQLNFVSQQLLGLWSELGIDAHQMAELSRVDVRIAELSGDTLGAKYGHVAWLDDDAADHGWSIGGSTSR